jgi:uncharacterized protein (TIGR02118 family)
VIKSVSLLTRKAGMTHAQFVKHWVEVHAPLALAVPGLRRYVQSHIVEERTRPDIPTTEVEVEQDLHGRREGDRSPARMSAWRLVLVS